MDLSVSNENNYKTIIDMSSIDIFKKYKELINSYFSKYDIFFLDDNYNKYVKIKGIFCISNVFKLLLLYTKNIDLTYHHTQTAIVYYIGFVEQIANTSNNYLNLNVKDAAMFTYKKTIFDIDRNINLTHSKIIDNISILINIYNFQIVYLIDYKKPNILDIDFSKLICGKKKFKDEDYLFESLRIMDLFKNRLNKSYDVVKILYLFTRKLISKKNIDLTKLEKNIESFKNLKDENINYLFN